MTLFATAAVRSASTLAASCFSAAVFGQFPSEAERAPFQARPPFGGTLESRLKVDRAAGLNIAKALEGQILKCRVRKTMAAAAVARLYGRLGDVKGADRCLKLALAHLDGDESIDLAYAYAQLGKDAELDRLLLRRHGRVWTQTHALGAAVDGLAMAGRYQAAIALAAKHGGPSVKERAAALAAGRAFESRSHDAGWRILMDHGVSRYGSSMIPEGPLESAFLIGVRRAEDWLKGNRRRAKEQLSRISKAHSHAMTFVLIGERFFHNPQSDAEVVSGDAEDGFSFAAWCLEEAAKRVSQSDLETQAHIVFASLRSKRTLPIAMRLLRPQGRGPNSDLASQAAWLVFRGKPYLEEDHTHLDLLLAIAFEGRLDAKSAGGAAAVVFLREGEVALMKVLDDRYKGQSYSGIFSDVIARVNSVFEPELSEVVLARMDRNSNSLERALAARSIAESYAFNADYESAERTLKSSPTDQADCRIRIGAYARIIFGYIKNTQASSPSALHNPLDSLMPKIWAECLAAEGHWTAMVKQNSDEWNRHALFDANASRVGIIRLMADSLAP